MKISDRLKKYENIITENYNCCVPIIVKFVSCLPEEEKQIALQKLDSVTFDYSDEIIENHDNAQMFHVTGSNTIFFTQKSYISSYAKLLHELHHCVSANSNSESGVSKTVYLGTEYKGNKYGVLFKTGMAINEGLTEYFTSKELGIAPTAYGEFVNLMGAVCSQCDENKIKRAYLTSDMEMFYDAIKEGFKLDDNQLVERLIMQAEAEYDLYLDSSLTYTKEINHEYSLAKTYETLLDMSATKYCKDNIDLTCIDPLKICDYRSSDCRMVETFKNISPLLNTHWKQISKNGVSYNKDIDINNALIHGAAIIIKEYVTKSISYYKNAGLGVMDYKVLGMHWDVTKNYRIDTCASNSVREALFTKIYKNAMLPKDKDTRNEVIIDALRSHNGVTYDVEKNINSKTFTDALISEPSFTVNRFPGIIVPPVNDKDFKYFGDK